MKGQGKVLWHILSFSLSKQVGLQVGIIHYVKNLWFFLHIIAEVKYFKEKTSQLVARAGTKA